MNRPSPAHCAVRLDVTEQDLGPRIYMVLWSSDEVVAVQVCYTEDDVEKLSGVRNLTGYDQEGLCLLLVPVQHVTEWLTEEGVESIYQMYNADQELLEYAH